MIKYHSLAILLHITIVGTFKEERKTDSLNGYCKTAPNHRSLTLKCQWKQSVGTHGHQISLMRASANSYNAISGKAEEYTCCIKKTTETNVGHYPVFYISSHS